MRILNCDGVVDGQGDVFEPDSPFWGDCKVPIQHEFKEELIHTWGYATLEMVKDADGKVVAVDADMDFQLPQGQNEDLLEYLYPAMGGSGIERRADWPEKGQSSWTKVSIHRIGLCLSRNCDHRIGQLSTGQRL